MDFQYDASNVMPSPDYMNQVNQGFNWQDFGNTIGDTATSVIGGFGTTTDANALNSLAIANLNRAQADAIRSNAENRKQITKSIFIVLVISILVVGIVAVVGKFWKG